VIRANKKKYLDERYFIWFEEVDFCKEIYKNRGEVWYTPAAECIDLVGRSFAKVSFRKKQSYFSDSMIKYFKKWHPVWQVLIIVFAWSFVNAICASFYKSNN
jgi:N-acetylglucosaminyl-diphospho-decaprenol L-rhamnosyltransferase